MFGLEWMSTVPKCKPQPLEIIPASNIALNTAYTFGNASCWSNTATVEISNLGTINLRWPNCTKLISKSYMMGVLTIVLYEKVRLGDLSLHFPKRNNG